MWAWTRKAHPAVNGMSVSWCLISHGPGRRLSRKGSRSRRKAWRKDCRVSSSAILQAIALRLDSGEFDTLSQMTHRPLAGRSARSGGRGDVQRRRCRRTVPRFRKSTFTRRIRCTSPTRHRVPRCRPPRAGEVSIRYERRHTFGSQTKTLPRPAPSGTGSRREDHRACALRYDGDHRDADGNIAARKVFERCRENSVADCRTQYRGAGHRVAAQHGWKRRAFGAIGACLCAKLRVQIRCCHRVAGRAAFDRCRHAHVARSGFVARQTRACRRQDGGSLYPAGRAGPAESTSPRMIANEDRPARFLWLPPGARPPHAVPRRQEMVFLLVGMTILFSGYDLNVFGMALPQIQRELHIPENMAAVTISYFRLAALPALFVGPLADIVGRRRLLLFTVFGEAIMTLLTAFSQDYHQFVAAQIGARIFGYSEEMLCFVVVAEEIDERVRGWSTGTLGAINATGAGLAALVFGVVNYLPYGWRSLYVIGSGGLFVLAYYRRWLPETRRYEIHRQAMNTMESKLSQFFR